MKVEPITIGTLLWCIHNLEAIQLQPVLSSFTNLWSCIHRDQLVKTTKRGKTLQGKWSNDWKKQSSPALSPSLKVPAAASRRTSSVSFITITWSIFSRKLLFCLLTRHTELIIWHDIIFNLLSHSTLFVLCKEFFARGFWWCWNISFQSLTSTINGFAASFLNLN